MLPRSRTIVFVFAITCFIPFLPGQTRAVSRGNKFRCYNRNNGPGHKQLSTSSWSCDTQGYTRVFTGTVRSAVDISDTETRLELIPDEAFLGDTSELTATVNQACLSEYEPEIQAGDKWLFYVRPKNWDGNTSREWHGNHTPLIHTDGLELDWDSPSKPVSEAEDDIASLRHLTELTDRSLLTGTVTRVGPTFDALNPTPVPNHKVLANSVESGTEYTAFTNVNGYFEFELPPGSYNVSASTDQGLKEADPFALDPKQLEEGNAHLRPRSCREMAFRLLVDGKLAGRVTTADGRPASFAKVAIIPVSPSRAPFTVLADENGHFEVEGRQPGQYLVGIGLLAPFDSAEWQSRVYYPGVDTREQARVIELDVGEWRTDIDFSLPPNSGNSDKKGDRR